MKTNLGILIVLLTATVVSAQPTNLTVLLQQGLFEEQANRNLDAAIADYQTLAAQFDKDRQLAATAVFRLGECYRMQGKTNEAALEYQRILRDFSDQTSLATLSRQDLAGMGVGLSPIAATQTSSGEQERVLQRLLLKRESQEAQQNLEELQKKIDAGTAPKADLLPAQQALAELQQQLAALASAAPPASEPEISDAKLWSSVKGLPPAELRKVLPNLIPDATLTSLLEKLNTAEQNLAVLTNDYASDNVQVRRLKSDLDTLNHQITDQIDGMMQALKLRAELSQPTVAASAPTDAEDQEIQRIKDLVQNSPDLINAESEGSTPLVKAAYNGWLKVAAYLLDHGAEVNRPCREILSGTRDVVHSVTPLVAAVAAGNRAMTQFLIERGADVNVGLSGDTPLAMAARKGFYAVAEVLIANKADVNAKNDQKYTPLHRAAASGNQDMVSLLLANHADVNAQDNSGSTPLFAAVQRNQLKVVQTLLAAGAEVNLKDNQGQTVLNYALGTSPEIFQALLTAGANPNTEDSDGRTLLSYAAERGSPEEVKMLLDAKANPNVADHDGRTPLSFAAERGSPEMVKMLLDAKANPNVADKDGRTPLSHAAEHGLPEMVKAILAAKADPNAGTIDAPLLCAVDKNNLGCAELLLQANANANVYGLMHCPQGSYGSRWYHEYSAVLRSATPLWLAIQKHQLPMVQLLLKYKADPDESRTDGRPLLFSELSDTNILEALLDAGAKVDAIDTTQITPNWMSDRTPLETATFQCNAAAEEILLKHGADPNFRDAHGYIALYWAAFNSARHSISEERSIFELLLDHHANPNVRNNDGKTPLDELKRLSADNYTSSEGRTVAIQLADLLRQHGALDVLPDWDRITVSRQGSDYSATVFQRDTDGWNYFTLLETILNYYESWSGSPSMWMENGGIPYPSNPGIPFPDLSKVAILHPNHDSTNITRTTVNLLNGANGIDCAKDAPLQFGDTVEIPEREHTLAEGDTNGPAWVAQISNCLHSRSGTVKLIVVGRQTIQVPLDQFGPLDCRVGQVLGSSEAQNVLTSDSDLSRVKVTRRDPKTGKPRELILNCGGTQRSPSPAGIINLNYGIPHGIPSPPGLLGPQVSQDSSGPWLRDGDVIEVPEKR
ncbi:MAG: ankyrin repeat domain-containing protein [Verrucomicrobiota bacterium]